MRYQKENKIKQDGETFTPKILADFTAERLVSYFNNEVKDNFTILEPSVGDGELLIALLRKIKTVDKNIKVYAFDTNPTSVSIAKSRIKNEFPSLHLDFRCADFLDFCSNQNETSDLFDPPKLNTKFDLIIANPPYVRTQIIGAEKASKLAQKFGLNGRIDLYQAFVISMFSMLKVNGCLGAIVSNRFLTTKSGNSIRQYMHKNVSLEEIWDLGDTKIFDAAVLPALIFGSNKITKNTKPIFTSIYENINQRPNLTRDIFEALKEEVLSFKTADEKVYEIKRGFLNFSILVENQPWAISNDTTNNWLQAVNSKSDKCFGDVAKIRVGIKSCADKVFLKKDWEELGDDKPELLFPLITRKNLSRFSFKKDKDVSIQRKVLYPYDMNKDERTPLRLDAYPKTEAYLNTHREILAARKYVIDAGREWYEIWVPHNPKSWQKNKIVFPDISEKGIFSLDTSGSIVSGECYWLVLNENENEELLYLILGIANSKFIEKFYDISFPNKLYSGKRRFITQYVNRFPIPNARLKTSQEIVSIVKKLMSCKDEVQFLAYDKQLNLLIDKAFGVST